MRGAPLSSNDGLSAVPPYAVLLDSSGVLSELGCRGSAFPSLAIVGSGMPSVVEILLYVMTITKGPLQLASSGPCSRGWTR